MITTIPAGDTVMLPRAGLSTEAVNVRLSKSGSEKTPLRGMSSVLPSCTASSGIGVSTTGMGFTIFHVKLVSVSRPCESVAMTEMAYEPSTPDCEAELSSVPDIILVVAS